MSRIVQLLTCRALSLLALGAAATSVFTGPAGKYREEIRNPFPRTDSTLVRTLNLFKDGKADLYSEYKGDKPQVNAGVRVVLGGLIDAVRDARKIRHSGTWRQDGNRLIVELDRLEVEGENRRVGSTFEFDLNRSGLDAVRQDSSDYGSRKMRLDLLEDWGSGDGGDFDPGDYKGTYGWGTEVKSESGRSTYIRRLKLNGDMSAELISEYQGQRPRLDKEATDDFGVLYSQVVSSRKITHQGKWRRDRDRIVVDLDRIGGGLFADRVSSEFVFNRSNRELRPVEWDRTDYGRREIRLQKDWSPDFDDRPSPPGEKPRPLPGGDKPYPEMDVTENGGGMLSYEGTSAREFDRLRLILRNDGRFEIRISGGASVVFSGLFEVDRGNTIDLEVRDAFGRSATGAGKVQLNRRGAVGTVTLRGDARGRRFTLNFTAR